MNISIILLNNYIGIDYQCPNYCQYFFYGFPHLKWAEGTLLFTPIVRAICR